MPRQECGRQSNKSDSHATFLEILDDPIAGPWIHHPAPEVQAGRAVVEFLADGYLRLRGTTTAMAATGYHGELRRQHLCGHGGF